MTRTLCAIILLAFAVAASAAQVSVVQDGKSDYVIGVSAAAGASEKFAAGEVAKYVKQMSGAELPIRPFDRNAPKQIGILPISSAPPTWDVSSVKIQGESIAIEGSNPFALLHACYVFLDQLGCRFLAPQFDHYQGSGELVPAKKSLVFDDTTVRPFKAQLKYRKLYVEEGHSHDEANLRQMIEWMPKAGYNVLVVPLDYQGRGRVKWDNWREALTPELEKRGIVIEVGGHGYQNFLNAEMEADDGGTLFQKHPEYFGTDAQGRRRKEHGRALCTSNSDAVAYLTKNVIEYVQARPEIAIFDLWPPDGVSWCQCEPCAKLGTPSDRQALLLNEVRRRIAKIRPDLKLEGIAYHQLKLPPEKVKLDSSVLIDFCPSRQNFEFALNDPAAPTRAEGNGYPNGELAAKLQAWRETFSGDISIYSYYRRYAWDSLPLVLPKFMQAELKFFKSLPVQGISTYCEPGDWCAYELNHYVLANLAWDVDQDFELLVRKFCDARYGAASEKATAAFAAMADVVAKYCSVPYVTLKSKSEIEAAHAKLSKAAEDVRTAKSSADSAQQRDIDRLLLSMEYALRDLAIQKLRAGGADDATIRREGAELHKFVSEHAHDGVFLVKNNRLALPRLLAHYGIDQRKRDTQTD